MKINQLVHVGYLLKPHGVHGTLKFVAQYSFPDEFLQINAFFLEHPEGRLPFIVESLESIAPNEYLVKFEDVSQKEEAEKLAHKQVYITEEQFNQWIDLDNLPEDYSYLIGYDLLNQDRQFIGSIEDVMNLPEHHLAQITVNGREVFIPLQEELIIEINNKKQFIQIDIPHGLLEMYTEE